MRFFDAQPGIRYLGHVDRATLLVEQQRARVMAYPVHVRRGFLHCRGRMHGGRGGPGYDQQLCASHDRRRFGVLVNGRPRSWFYRRAFVKAAVRLLTDDQHWHARSVACRASCPHLGFAAVADQFLRLCQLHGRTLHDRDAILQFCWLCTAGQTRRGACSRRSHRRGPAACSLPAMGRRVPPIVRRANEPERWFGRWIGTVKSPTTGARRIWASMFA